MNAARIAELRALAEKATPGPWSADSDSIGNWTVVEPPENTVAYPMKASDAIFIAAARTALPEALDELDRQENIALIAIAKAQNERKWALDAIERVRAVADLDDDLVKNAQRAFDNEPTGFEGDGYEPMRAALKTLVDNILASLEGKSGAVNLGEAPVRKIADGWAVRDPRGYTIEREPEGKSDG